MLGDMRCMWHLRLGIGLMVLGLAAPPVLPPATAQDERPLVFGATLPLLPLNAFADVWTEASAAILSRLYTIGHDGQLIGDLVASHRVSPDGLTWTLALRPEARWHDGEPFTSADVVHTFDEMRRPTARSPRWRNLAVISRYDAPERHALVLRLSSPRPELPVALAEVPIMPRHVLAGRDANDDAVFDARPVGTGPYRLVRRTPEGRLLFEAHTSYHLGRPRIARLEMVTIADDEARARAVINGSVDLAHIKPQHLSLVRASTRHVVESYPSGIWRSLVLNVRQPHLADRRVRQAIDLVLDREAIVREGLLGVGTPAFSPIPPMNWAHQPSPPRRRDPARARALLDEAGWRVGPDGWRTREGRRFDLALAVWWTEPFRRAASLAVKQNLEAIGLPVRLIEVPADRYEAVAASLVPEHDGIITGYSGLLDPGHNLATKYRTGGLQNAGGYSNAEVDRLLDAALQQGDREKALPLYRDVLALIEADAARLPLAYVDYLFAARADLKGVAGNVLDLYYHFPRLAYRLHW